MQKYLAILFLFVTASACSKNSESADKETPVVQLASPSNNQVFSAGDMVSINAAITDNSRIAEIHVHISNNNTAQLLIDIHRYPDAASYALSESFTAQAGISYKIQIIAIDKSANQKNETVTVSAN
jgi:hypothetical protein